SLSTGYRGRGSIANEGKQLTAAARVVNAEPIAGQRLAARDVAQLERKAFERREARRLQVEMSEIEPPTCTLLAGVLADQAVEPALDTARQREIRAVDR